MQAHEWVPIPTQQHVAGVGGWNGSPYFSRAPIPAKQPVRMFAVHNSGHNCDDV